MPSYAPVETVTVRANVAEATRRVVALYTAEGIPVQSASGSVITTAPVAKIALASRAGSTQANGTVSYFFRATVTGDTVSTVALALWAGLTTRVGGDPESTIEPTPVTPACLNTPACSEQLTRMRAHAAALRR